MCREWPSEAVVHLDLADLQVHGGVAFSHFNTTLKSKQTWHLGLATKQSAFTALNKSAPTQR